jgi:cyclopropane fatty-acyl-phospholipid synthase-like methyltransferase
MSSPRSFDRLAKIYRALEFVAFGRTLEEARFSFLNRLHHRHTILVLGEGDGRCLERLVRVVPHAQVDCMEQSAAMISVATARLTNSDDRKRVNFWQVDLLAAELPPARYDAVITFFLLDCFTEEQARNVIGRIHRSLKPGALWLWADFSLPKRGFARWRARIWLWILYGFFRWQTGLHARKLPPVDRLLAERGYQPTSQRSWQWGLVRSAVWRRGPVSSTPFN